MSNPVPGSEKLLKLDARAREYDVLVIGEEPFLAYNRLGLSTFFKHRKIEDLYLNPQEWVRGKPPASLVIQEPYVSNRLDVSMIVPPPER